MPKTKPLSVRVTIPCYEEWVELVDRLVGHKRKFTKVRDLFEDMLKEYGRSHPRIILG